MCRKEARILDCITLHSRQRFRPVRHARRVAEIDKLFVRQLLVQRAIHGQAADAAIEDADGKIGVQSLRTETRDDTLTSCQTKISATRQRKPGTTSCPSSSSISVKVVTSFSERQTVTLRRFGSTSHTARAPFVNHSAVFSLTSVLLSLGDITSTAKSVEPDQYAAGMPVAGM